ncbi:MAG: nuclear transport factor 2 family protein [Acidimicrobiales bacterium]
MTLDLHDRQAITELLSRYGLLIDQRRLDEWTALFTEACEFVVPGMGTFRTVEDRRRMVENGMRGVHLVASPVIRAGDADGTAEAEQSFMFRASETGRFMTGWYSDTLVKQDGVWLIARRAIQYISRQ